MVVILTVLLMQRIFTRREKEDTEKALLEV